MTQLSSDKHVPTCRSVPPQRRHSGITAALQWYHSGIAAREHGRFRLDFHCLTGIANATRSGGVLGWWARGAAGALVSEEARSCSAVKPARSAGQRLGSDRRGALPGLVVSPARQILSSTPWPSSHRPLRLALGIGPARLRRDPRGSAPRPQTRLDILALKANKPQRLAVRVEPRGP